MQKWICGCIAMMFFLTTHVSAQDAYADKVAKYVSQYKYLAIAEQRRSGVPAAIILGQGILETEAGCSELVTGANNHFGIKCRSEWTGETFAHTDDAPNECFRKYKCADDSYKDHSDYLKNSPRYASLFLLSKTDYPAWATGLKKCGYATNPRYAQQLIKIIEDFKLQEYTYAAMNSDLISQEEKKEILGSDAASAGKKDTTGFNKTKAVPDKAPSTAIAPVTATPLLALPTKAQVINVNGLKAIYGYKGDMLLQYAIKYQLRYAHLLEINDLPDAPLASNMYIYLEKKNTKGVHDTHIVKPGESLIQVAQLEGMQLRRLMALNHLNLGDAPVPGTVLELQGYAASKPQLMTASANPAKPVSAIKVHHYDDFISTGKKPGAAIHDTVVTEKKARPIIKSAPPIPVVVEKKEQPTTVTPIPIAVEEKLPAIIPSTPTPIVDEKKEEAPVITTTPAADEKSPQVIAATTPAIPDAAVITKEPEMKVAKPVSNEAVVIPEASVSDNKKIIETKQAPATDLVQTKIPEQKTIVAEQKPAEPMDDLARLKAELDKVVYTKPVAVTPAAVLAAPESVSPKAKKTTEAKNMTTAKYYTVKTGDTAFDIAKEHNITVHQLMEWNNIDFDEIKTGKRLRVK